MIHHLWSNSFLNVTFFILGFLLNKWKKITTISVSLDEKLVEWLDHLVAKGVIKNRSEAVEGNVYVCKDRVEIRSGKNYEII